MKPLNTKEPETFNIGTALNYMLQGARVTHKKWSSAGLGSMGHIKYRTDGQIITQNNTIYDFNQLLSQANQHYHEGWILMPELHFNDLKPGEKFKFLVGGLKGETLTKLANDTAFDSKYFVRSCVATAIVERL